MFSNGRQRLHFIKYFFLPLTVKIINKTLAQTSTRVWGVENQFASLEAWLQHRPLRISSVLSRMQSDEQQTTQLIIFQSEMPELAKIECGASLNGENGDSEKKCSPATSVSTSPPINVARTITEADLTFKGPATESDGDAASETRDTAVTPENQDRYTDGEILLQNLDLENLEFFWDGRYHQTSYIKQYDILDDGEPPPPRAGWPIQQLNLRAIVLNLEHPPLLKGPQNISYFSLELHLGDQVYKTPVCMGDATQGFVKFDQLFTAHIDDDVLEAVAVSLRDGTVGPVLTAVVYDCGRRFKNTVPDEPHSRLSLRIRSTNFE